MKYLLKGGKVYDGTGSDAYIGDILFEDDRVLQVAPSIDEALADSVTDISGKSVSSGFIDCHSHNDWFAIKKAPLPYFDPFIRQGITTFVTGNCGLSSIGFEKDTPFLDKIGGGFSATGVIRPAFTLQPENCLMPLMATAHAILPSLSVTALQEQLLLGFPTDLLRKVKKKECFQYSKII